MPGSEQRQTILSAQIDCGVARYIAGNGRSTESKGMESAHTKSRLFYRRSPSHAYVCFERTAEGDLEALLLLYTFAAVHWHIACRFRCCFRPPNLHRTGDFQALNRISAAAAQDTSSTKQAHRRQRSDKTMFFSSTPFAEAEGRGHADPGRVGFSGAHAHLHLPRLPRPLSRLHSHSMGLAAADYCSSFHYNRLPVAFTMAAYESRQDELAQFQELSNKWEPEATVGLTCRALV